MSIFPTLAPEVEARLAEKKELSLFCEYAYDFENNRLLLNNGKTYLISGNEALRVWIFKALHTVRYAHVAYSRAYGTEVRGLMGQPVQRDILLPELQRFIVEALMPNPYIKQLKNFVFTVEGAAVTVRFECVTAYGEMALDYNYEGG